jgi:hypothetical protein
VRFDAWLEQVALGGSTCQSMTSQAAKNEARLKEVILPCALLD